MRIFTNLIIICLSFFSSCTITHLYKLNSNTTYASTLYQRKGFLIATSNNEMNVYNTSNVLKQMPYLTSTHAFKNAIPRMSIPSSSSSNNNGGSGWFGSHSSAESTGKAKDHEILSSFSILPNNKIQSLVSTSLLKSNYKMQVSFSDSIRNELVILQDKIKKIFINNFQRVNEVFSLNDINKSKTIGNAKTSGWKSKIFTLKMIG